LKKYSPRKETALTTTLLFPEPSASAAVDWLLN